MSNKHDVQRRFPVDIKDHKLTILKDDGIYRHIRLKKPGSSEMYLT